MILRWWLPGGGCEVASCLTVMVVRQYDGGFKELIMWYSIYEVQYGYETVVVRWWLWVSSCEGVTMSGKL